jgi:outer membrane protein TolC
VKSIKSATVSFALAVVIGTRLVAGAAESSGESAQRQKLADLLTERRDTLRKLVEAVELQYHHGAGTLDAVVRASNDLLDAELALAPSEADRIAILERIVQNLKALEEMVSARYNAGRATISDVLSAKAARLNAEILLLTEREELEAASSNRE